MVELSNALLEQQAQFQANLPKQLRVKFGAVKRIHKEYLGYQQEETKQRQRIDKLMMELADESDIKQQVKTIYYCIYQNKEAVLQETLNMYANVKTRLIEANQLLKSWLTENSQSESVKDLEETQQALDYISQVDQFLTTI